MDTTVTLDISISLDGYVTAAGRTPEEPLGRGGERLHDWIGTDDGGRDVLNDGLARLGAVVTGRSTYDGSVPWWGADGPSGALRRPVFVVTHEPPAESPENGVYTFVTGGIEDALARARAAAGDGVVCVMGGADVARQCLAAGLIDEISLHVVPVLFGDGTPLFDRATTGHVELENVSTIQTDAATHLVYRVTPAARSVR